jgi:hypothetical protein
MVFMTTIPRPVRIEHVVGHLLRSVLVVQVPDIEVVRPERGEAGAALSKRTRALIRRTETKTGR